MNTRIVSAILFPCVLFFLASCTDHASIMAPESEPSAINGNNFYSGFCDDDFPPTAQAGNGELQLELCSSLGTPGVPLARQVKVRAIIDNQTIAGESNLNPCWFGKFNWTAFIKGKEGADQQYDDDCNTTSGTVIEPEKTYLVTTAAHTSVAKNSSNVARDRFFFRMYFNRPGTEDVFAVWRGGEFKNLSDPTASSGHYFPAENLWHVLMPTESQLFVMYGLYNNGKLNGITLNWHPFLTMGASAPISHPNFCHLLKVAGRSGIGGFEVFDSNTIAMVPASACP